MRSRVLLVSVMVGVMLPLAALGRLPAQILTARPVPLRSPSVASAMAPGTGPFAVFLNDRGQWVQLGNAAAVSFQDPSAGSQGSSGTAQGGTVVVQFASNDQLAQTLPREPCAMAGNCAFVLQINQLGASGQIATVYTMQGVYMTQIQMGSAITATFRYQAITAGPPGQSTPPAPQGFGAGGSSSTGLQTQGGTNPPGPGTGLGAGGANGTSASGGTNPPNTAGGLGAAGGANAGSSTNPPNTSSSSGGANGNPGAGPSKVP
jgi:hypothetical protein